MSANISNVDVILDTEDLDVPSCPHGPALLFIKYDQDGDKPGKQRKFFACSAFRDRKQCRFFQYADEKISKEKMEERKLITKGNSPKYSHEDLWNRSQRLQHTQVHDSARVYCHTCDLLLLPEEHQQHKGHTLKMNISCSLLQRPTQLFQPQDNNKTYAQYLFASSTVTFTLEALDKLGVTHVLCVGAPRIHEAVTNRSGSKGHSTRTLLLDLDARYMQVYSSSQFCRFNMFNFHFFDSETSQQVYQDFVTPSPEKRVAIVTDPPFGGMVEALARTMSRIMFDCLRQDKDEEEVITVPVLWFFPYFLEKRITEAIPALHMLDYKVDYDNHSLFSAKKKKGSPVRIFTNLQARQIPLPSSEGYRWCEVCEQYSAEENKHCDKCGRCTSKDGTSYVHCETCERCVKPSWAHCSSCNRCQLQDHKCGSSQESGCHICGQSGHKRRDCPLKHLSNRKRKKELAFQSGAAMSRNKKRKKSEKKEKKKKIT
ncbi:rRNA N(6)-adenosine-methyltransferase ZCCHC4-like [Haliotis cracherodii]|uniref:rRNA N(6)-adenosine-methyltransferase ZCCHC4-like n=1 Tax=Haliotis cracherodii TaxID=6455 RepID=UPI0039E7CD7E